MPERNLLVYAAQIPLCSSVYSVVKKQQPQKAQRSTEEKRKRAMSRIRPMKFAGAWRFC